jgi:hypothetical protein
MCQHQAMKTEYDLTKMKSRPNPYAARLRQQVALRLRRDTLEYFRELAEESGLECHALIDLYLTDCAESHLRLPQLLKHSPASASPSAPAFATTPRTTPARKTPPAAPPAAPAPENRVILSGASAERRISRRSSLRR